MVQGGAGAAGFYRGAGPAMDRSSQIAPSGPPCTLNLSGAPSRRICMSIPLPPSPPIRDPLENIDADLVEAAKRCSPALSSRSFLFGFGLQRGFTHE